MYTPASSSLDINQRGFIPINFSECFFSDFVSIDFDTILALSVKRVCDVSDRLLV